MKFVLYGLFSIYFFGFWMIFIDSKSDLCIYFLRVNKYVCKE